MADETPTPPPLNPTKPGSRTTSGGFGKRGRKAPPVVLKAGEGAPPEATRRRIRNLTLGLGAAGAAALAALAANQYSTRRACEEAVRRGEIVGPECPAPSDTAAHATGSGGWLHTSSSHWSGWHLLTLFRSSGSSYSSHSTSTSTPTSASSATHGFSFGGFGSHGSAHGGGS